MNFRRFFGVRVLEINSPSILCPLCELLPSKKSASSSNSKSCIGYSITNTDYHKWIIGEHFKDFSIRNRYMIGTCYRFESLAYDLWIFWYIWWQRWWKHYENKLCWWITAMRFPALSVFIAQLFGSMRGNGGNWGGKYEKLRHTQVKICSTSQFKGNINLSQKKRTSFI